MYMHIFNYIYLPTSEAGKVEQNIHTYIYIYISIVGDTDKSNSKVSICVGNFKTI